MSEKIYLFVLAEGSQYGKLWEDAMPPPTNITHQTRVTIKDFVFHKVLGKGSFGKVRIHITHFYMYFDFLSLSSFCIMVGDACRAERKGGIFCH